MLHQTIRQHYIRTYITQNGKLKIKQNKEWNWKYAEVSCDVETAIGKQRLFELLGVTDEEILTDLTRPLLDKIR